MTAGLQWLTPEQAEQLRLHLAAELQESTADAGVVGIDRALGFVCGGLSPSEWRQRRNESYRHMSQVAELASRLVALLEDDQPPGMATLVDWPVFRDWLRVVGARADQCARVMKPSPGAGRPPNEWRDKLIAFIYSLYPPGQGTKARGSHFERTVEMVLGFVGRGVQDVHGMIVDSLLRSPEPPFTVEPRRRLRRVK